MRRVAETSGLVVVPPVVEPIPVHIRPVGVAVQVRHVEVVIVVPDERAECLPYHHSLKSLVRNLRVESNSAS
jgi:hypothetical protein